MARKPEQITLLPEPPFTPQWPQSNTLAHLALDLLLKGKEISHPDFQSNTSSWRLAAYILTLKKLGWPVKTNKIVHSTQTEPYVRHIHTYYLPDKIIEQVNNINDNMSCG